MAELSQAILVPTIYRKGGIVYNPNVKFTYQSLTQSLTQSYFQISYDDNGYKVLNATLGYKFQKQSKEGKINLIDINDKKNNFLENLLDKIVIGKGEQVTIYTHSRSPPHIITNP
jgi:hypothetical protein